MDRLPLLATSALILCFGAQAFADPKPPATFNAAHSGNFTRVSGSRSITHVVIHTIEGSASSAQHWFKNPRSKVSAHYVVGFDGRLTQMVRDQDRAWHARGFNRNSIGVEHAGYASRNQWTDAQYRGSARLVRWLCDTYRIPKDREHIIGHVEVPGTRHKVDPGRHFNWDYYIRLIRGEAGDLTRAGGASDPDVEDPSDTSTDNGGHDGHGHGPDPEDAPGPYAIPLSPGRGQVIGLLHTRWREGNASSGYPGLKLEWTVSDAPQRGARVQLQEAGRGGLRYDSGTLSGGTTAHRISAKLQHGKTYRWRVSVSDGSKTDTSAWVTFRTDFTPARVRATAPVGGATVTGAPVFRWSYEDSEGGEQASYRIYVDDDEDHSTIVYDTKELNGPSTSHALRPSLTPGKTYFWRVMGYDGRGNPSFSGWQAFRVAPEVTVSAHLLTLTNDARQPSYERPVMRWRFENSAGRPQTGFRLQIETQEGVRSFDSTYSSSATAFRASGLPAGAYRWRVGVSDGENVAWSGWGAFTVFDPPPLRGGLANRVGQ